MLIAVGLMVLSLVALVWSADRFVLGASATAINFGISPLVVGLTIIGFGTSASELLISGFAARGGNVGLSIGNALGSNITNIALVLGLTAVLKPLLVRSTVLKRELPLMLGCMLLGAALLIDLRLARVDGMALAFALLLVLLWLIREARHAMPHDELREELREATAAPLPPRRALFWLALGLVVLLVAARLFVWSAVTIAATLGVDELVIGLTIVAFGTSLPELAASVAGVLRNEHDIALGNVVGSNIFNVLGVLSLPALIQPSVVPEAVVYRDLPVMLALGFALLVMAIGLRGRQGRINRLEGAVLLGVFAGYQYLLFVSLQ